VRRIAIGLITRFACIRDMICAALRFIADFGCKASVFNNIKHIMLR
jgi:hypothetical protein